MTAIINIKKIVALTFRGFDLESSQIEEMFGVRASDAGRRGSPVKPGVKTKLKRSFVRFSLEMEASSRLDQVIPAILNHLGGVEKISGIRDVISPDFFEIDITWPVKSSDEQEGGFFPASVLLDLSRLQCALSFGFV